MINYSSYTALPIFMRPKTFRRYRQACRNTFEIISAMFSTGCQSHSASSISFVYNSSFYHFTELLQSSLQSCMYLSACAFGLISPRPGYGYHHWRGLMSMCGGWGRTLEIVLSLPRAFDAGTVSLLLFVWLTHLKLTCSLRLTIFTFSCLYRAIVVVWPAYGAV